MNVNLRCCMLVIGHFIVEPLLEKITERIKEQILCLPKIWYWGKNILATFL